MSICFLCRPYLLQWDVSVHVLEPQGFQTNATSKDAVSKGMMKLWNNLNRQTKEEFGKEYFDGCTLDFPFRCVVLRI